MILGSIKNQQLVGDFSGLNGIIGLAWNHPVVMVWKIWCKTDWWFGTMDFFYDFPIILGMENHPNWRTPSFLRGVGWNHQPENLE